MRRLAAAIFLSLAATAASAAEPAVDAAEWLLKASESARHVSYRGVVVYRDDERMETLRVVHRHKDGREQERLTSLTGAARDLVREDEHVRCISAHDHADEPTDSPQGMLPALSRKTLREVAAHYGLRMLGEARVADRLARGVAIEPRDEFRYGYEIWADGATAVPLKVSLVDRRGRVVEQMLYTEIAFPSRIPDRAFALGPGLPGMVVKHSAPAAPVPVAQASALAKSNAWSVTGLPPGFRIALRQAALEGENVVEHVLMSDGLSAVSVFAARPTETDSLFRGYSRMGAMNAYGRMVGVYHVTVVGEVPQATVRRIGDGLTPAQP